MEDFLLCKEHNNLRSHPELIILPPPTDLLRMAHLCLAGGQRGKLIQTSILKNINQCIWPKLIFKIGLLQDFISKVVSQIALGMDYSGKAALLVCLNRILQKEIWIVVSCKYIYNSICTGGRYLVIFAKHLGLPNNKICNVMRPQEAFQHLNVTNSRKLNNV